MAKSHTLEVPIQGMDCAECTQHVQHALAQLSGVVSVNVLLSSEKAVLHLDPDKVDMPAIRKAVASAGNYSVPDTAPAPAVPPTGALTRRLGVVLTGVFVVVLAIVVGGEWLGAFQTNLDTVSFTYMRSAADCVLTTLQSVPACPRSDKDRLV